MSVIKPLSMTEMTRCQDVLLSHVTRAYGLDDPRQAVKDIFAALYEQRYGPAEGSTAYRASDGATATRYYDPDFGMLRWIKFTSVAKNDVKASRVDTLEYGWKITARPWQELVYVER